MLDERNHPHGGFAQRLTQKQTSRRIDQMQRDDVLLCGTTQWKESPQAQEPCAFGLSIVKPCFSMLSTKSMVAPDR